MWKFFARKHLQLRLQYSYHSGESRQIWGWPYNAQCAWTTFWETFTPVTASTVQNVHTNNILKDFHFRKQPTLCKMCMHNILRDLHIRKLTALCKMCTHTTFWKTFISGTWWHCARCVQHSQRPSGQRTDGITKDVHTHNILKDLHFRELMVFFWKLKNVKEGCLVLR